jgi:hypothetical protein
VVTLAAWVAAKAGCNARERGVAEPKPLGAEMVRRNPKGTALELQQRLVTADFAGARGLVAPAAAPLIDEAQARCKREPQAVGCKTAAKLFTRAELLEAPTESAEVRVQTFDAAGTLVQTARIALERGTDGWWATAWTPE